MNTQHHATTFAPNDEATLPLPVYRCHKTVGALKIRAVNLVNDEGWNLLFFEDRNYPPMQVSDAYIQKHDPRPGGYFIHYEDGYESWSPADVFEAGYALISPGYEPHGPDPDLGSETAITDETGAGAGLDLQGAVAQQAAAEEAAPTPPHLALQTAAQETADQETAAELVSGSTGQVLEARHETAKAHAESVLIPGMGRIVIVQHRRTGEVGPALVSGHGPDNSIHATWCLPHQFPVPVSNLRHASSDDGADLCWSWPERV